jgi:hypothetical protein
MAAAEPCSLKMASEMAWHPCSGGEKIGGVSGGINGQYSASGISENRQKKAIGIIGVA